jgi:DNA-binding MarR family transcriptional regulator
LRATQFNILAEIRGAGEATVTELTKVLFVDQTTLTRGLALLERDGLLRPVPKPDGRLKSVRLTEKGEKALQSAFPLWAHAQKKMMVSIGVEAWAKLQGDLDRLAEIPNVHT